MKMFISFILLVLSASSFATVDSQTFIYDGSQDSIELTLNAEKTHTEYRYEQRPSICYRQEVFYRTVCQGTPHGRVCHTIPEYRTIPYSCIQTVRIPFEVKDLDVQATVTVNVASLDQALAPHETVTAKLNGETLSLEARGSKQFFIVQKKPTVTSQLNGRLKFIEATYSLDLVPAAPVMKALSMTNISLHDSVLNFTMGPVATRTYIGFSLNILKNPILGSSTVLFDRTLTAAEATVQSDEVAASVNVNIDQLGVKMESGRHTLTAKAFFTYPGMMMVLNSSDFDHLEASRTLIYKVR